MQLHTKGNFTDKSIADMNVHVVFTVSYTHSHGYNVLTYRTAEAYISIFDNVQKNIQVIGKIIFGKMVH